MKNRERAMEIPAAQKVLRQKQESSYGKLQGCRNFQQH